MSIVKVMRSVDPRIGGTLVGCSGAVLRAQGAKWPVASLVEIGPAAVLAQCIGFEGATVLLAPLSHHRGLVHGLRVAKLDGHSSAGVIPALGRVIDALGRPVDGGGILDLQSIPAGPPLRPHDRAPVTQVVETGIRAIDGSLTLGLGQRVAVVAAAGVGKTTLLMQIVANSRADAIVVALVGERGREVADFHRAIAATDNRAKTVIVAATSDEAPALRLRAATHAHAIAGALREQGRNVLLVLDSLTRAAQAQREIGLAVGEPAGTGAYPPSAFALVPTLVERAGGDTRSGGSVTALYTVLAEAGDHDDPIVDAARAATDGHIVLSKALAERGTYPAIDVGRSLSRTMSATVDAVHLEDARRLRRAWSLGEEYRELQSLGAYRSGQDDEIDCALASRVHLLDFVAQRSDQFVPLAQTRASMALLREAL